eukprot:m.306900 g.306900  ORF g.306900 m.306900 type:complete len:285 (+) comp41695_c0_seq1:30-884(+)
MSHVSVLLVFFLAVAYATTTTLPPMITSKPNTVKTTTKAPSKKPTKSPTTHMPPPSYKPSNYSVKANGSVCQITAALQFTLSYNDTNGKVKNHSQNFSSARSTVSGTCSKVLDDGTKMSSIVIDFNQSAYVASFEFRSTVSENLTVWYISQIAVNIDLSRIIHLNETGPVIIRAVNASNATETQNVPYGSALKCDTEGHENLTVANASDTVDEMMNISVAISMKEVHLDPFGLRQEVTYCYLDSHSSHVVPVVVGCALAGLVVIVLIAYFIGRSKNDQKGYQSL